jgi:hypothetical protein
VCKGKCKGKNRRNTGTNKQEVIAFDEIYIFRRASVDDEGYEPWRKHLIPKDSLQEYNDRNLSQ